MKTGDTMEFPFNALGLSHKFMFENVKLGSFCIDATAGRGRDTLFLSKLVGPQGRVIALDIQEEAVNSTNALLLENHVTNAEVFHACHSKMDHFAENESADGIMFNFGWLPGGNHLVFSKPDTSIVAIEKGLKILKPGGVMTLCIYHGKETGYEEKNALLEYVKTIDPKQFSVLFTDFVNRKGDVPIAVLIKKD